MGIGAVERAFQLAPDCGSLDEIRLKLKKEGFSAVEEHLAGPRIQAQLKQLLRTG